MLKRIIQACILLTGGTLGMFILPSLFTLIGIGNVHLLYNSYVFSILGALIFYLITSWLITYFIDFIKRVEEFLINTPVKDLILGSVGLMFGLAIAFLVGSAFYTIHLPIINTVAPILLTLLFGYLGFEVGLKKRDELFSLFSKNKNKPRDKKLEKVEFQNVPKILDTSVIIDGRIADICQAGFLEGRIMIPQFVLLELQHIADSSDVIKRNRGRRGLDILNHIQKEFSINIEIFEDDFVEMQEVDSKLVKLAKLTNGVVVTNDFNLNKVCKLQNISVLNINDLANALKPVVVPGEEINVQVIQYGKEKNQGIGYLDDGTIIVIEGGQDYIGKQIDVLVKSVLQKSAGRMIFAKTKILENGLF
ncbi:PIN/TRAM domain-containing protein [Niallia oryzisoli]|uniref:PIN/TRAM domain-containing protein n=1 Tax=Niallia oryzisoli TaxID=1737571 RepID=UPI003734E309